MKMEGTNVPLYRSLTQASIYKGGQGRLIRHVVLLVFISCVLLACRQTFSVLSQYVEIDFATWISCTLIVAGVWCAFRSVQHPPIADFLIDVQFEALKVSWCTWRELQRTTCVVLTAMVVLITFLFACDVSWQFLLRSLFILSI